MRTLIANAAPCPYALKQELIDEARRRLPLRGLRLHRARCRDRPPARGPAAQARIVRHDLRPDRGAHRAATTARCAPVGEPGELFIRTTLEMDGYHQRDERSREHDAEWKSVGDVAYLDDEGYLYICDRKKDMIISGGVNIYPAEIEAVIHEHPAVLDVAVFGVPDDEWGERVHAIVQPRPGDATRPRRPARVRRRARRRIQAAARLRGARRAAPHRVGQAAQARAARRVLGRSRDRSLMRR